MYSSAMMYQIKSAVDGAVVTLSVCIIIALSLVSLCLQTFEIICPIVQVTLLGGTDYFLFFSPLFLLKYAHICIYMYIDLS